MNKTAIKNFAIWARNKLIADVKYKAGLLGITETGIKTELDQSSGTTQFFDIGTDEPYAIHGKEIKQREQLVQAIRKKEADSSYENAYKYILEEVAYTWFNRLIAIRFMEVNDYMPARVRVLSSETGKIEPDIVTTPFDAELTFTPSEKEQVLELKNDNKLDELFCMLFIKQCNALNEYLPELFEKTNHYTELLLNLSFIDKDGVVYHLVNDIEEKDFNVEDGGQVEIIGWLYQYYNTEPKNEAFAKSGKITKDEIPAVTQLFTPDWIVRYMVENSLGRLWIEGHPNDELKAKWKYYLEEAEQEEEVEEQLKQIRAEHAKLKPEEIKLMDPCMGSGHILVYAFEVFIQIYEAAGWSKRDAARSILENNIYGLDIDDRAGQMAYFAVMMKAMEYDRRILKRNVGNNVYSIQESNGITTAPLHDMGVTLSQEEYGQAAREAQELIAEFHDAKEYGSIINVAEHNWELLERFAVPRGEVEGQLELDIHGEQEASKRLQQLIKIGKSLAQKYEVVVTNPPYMSISSASKKVSDYVKKYYISEKVDLYSVFITKCNRMCQKNGFRSMITQHGWMFLGSFEKMRIETLKYDIINMLHLGARAFEEIGGEVVQTVAFVSQKRYIKEFKAKFCRLIGPTSQNGKEEMFLNRENVYVSSVSEFAKIPGMPVAYWVSEPLKKAFSEKLLCDYAYTKQGFATGNNDIFLRLWQEVSYNKVSLYNENARWYPCNKGGSYRKWYGNNSYVANWENNGNKMRSYNGSVIRNSQFYFKEGITWSSLANQLSLRYSPNGYVFESKGSMCYTKGKINIKYLLGILNCKIISEVLLILSPTLDFHEGPMGKVPIINVKNESINDITDENICICKNDWDAFEESWDFIKHPLTKEQCKGRLILDKYKEWEDECNARFNQLKANEEELNRIFIDIYGLQDELTPEVEDKDVTVRKADLTRDIKSLLSYAVGCMFGRYSLDVDGLAFAGGDWDVSKYSSFLPYEDNIIPITDEEYLEGDIVTRLCEWLKVVYGADTLEQNLDFIASALGSKIKGNTSREKIRNYFLGEFFKDHCKTYSVTGSGKRPIYWLFDSGKQNGFKALIYLHRYNADTIGNLRVDYLHKLQRVYDSEINRMQDTIDNSDNNREVTVATKRKEKLTKQLKECREYDEKIGHLALERIELDLDDGVKYNYRRIQTSSDGNLYEVLADSKAIMMDAKKYAKFKEN